METCRTKYPGGAVAIGDNAELNIQGALWQLETCRTKYPGGAVAIGDIQS